MMLLAQIDDSGAGKYASALREGGARFLHSHEPEDWHLTGVETQNGLSLKIENRNGDRFRFFVLNPTLTLADDIFHALEQVHRDLVLR